MDIGVAYKENVDRVIQIIKDMGAEMRQDPYFKRLILDDLEMLGVDDFADSAVVIKFRIKTLPIKQWEVMREFRRRIKNKFDEVGIEIPFPHRTMYWGTGKDNEWMKTAAGNFSAARDEKNS
jgi:small conductance mechanosensitive channel